MLLAEIEIEVTAPVQGGTLARLAGLLERLRGVSGAEPR